MCKRFNRQTEEAIQALDALQTVYENLREHLKCARNEQADVYSLTLNECDRGEADYEVDEAQNLLDEVLSVSRTLKTYIDDVNTYEYYESIKTARDIWE